MKDRVLPHSLFGSLLLLGAAACSNDGHLLATRSDASSPGEDEPDARAAGGNPDEPGASADAGEPQATCTPASDSESVCGDGRDDDCDGFADCRDPDCDKKSCGAAELTCTAGACLRPNQGLPPLPRIDNVRVTQRADTAIVEFEPVENARDYRIYPLPESADVLSGASGELVIKNAIYRCAGDRPFRARKDDPATAFDASLSGGANLVNDFTRKEADALLGYVYLTPGPEREAVYRLANPEAGGGFMNADWVVPLYAEANGADYVLGSAARDALVAKGWRDDGIAFYAPSGGTRPVYRKEYKGLWNGDHVSLFFTDQGAEYAARQKEPASEVVDFGERFRIFADAQPGTVALHRVLYNYNESFDVLAAGTPRYQRVLNQGNQPVWSLTWPGLTRPTTLVIEALDQGCPFADGYVSASDAPADDFNFPSLSLDKARLASGEAFINGQFDPKNRPRPIARAYVDVTPKPQPSWDWYQSFDQGAAWPAFEVDSGNNGVFIYRNEKWAVDFSGCTDNLTFGPLLGQLVLGFADYGSSCNMSMVPRDVDARIAQKSFLHVRMSTTIPSTGRRYPQLMITTTDVLNPGDVQPLDNVPLHARLGPFSFQNLPPGKEKSIVVQPFGGYHELQLEFCDGRGWGVSEQCPRANIYGAPAGDYTEKWDVPWLPVPVLGDLAGFDRPVQFDVYASTERVYVFIDDKPAGCGVLPAGRMPEGQVNVAFRAVLYHSGIDESVTPEDSGHQYLRRFSLSHFDRSMDDFGIDVDVPAPAWDETRMPCGTRWYGG
jgi:hypothetical protein